METAPAPPSGLIEVEVKFTVGPGTEAALAALGAVGLPHIPPFRDTYFDGPDAPLGRADIWLRHRQGQGWQLKLLHGAPRPPHSATETQKDAEATHSPPEAAGSDPQLPHSGSEPHSSSETRSGPKPHSNHEPHRGSKPHRGPDSHSIHEPHSGPRGPKPHSGSETRRAPEPHSGPETPSGSEPPHRQPSAPHSGPGPHSGSETRSGPETHSGSEPHSGPELPPSPPPPPSATTAYREVWGDAAVLGELQRVLGARGGPWGSVGAALGPLGLRPTASFVTRRRGALLGGLRVVLDEADFGYGLGEVEQEVAAGGAPEVAAARGRVEGLCRALGAEPQRRVPGKLSVFLARHRPRYYRLLREAGRLEGLQEGEGLQEAGHAPTWDPQ